MGFPTSPQSTGNLFRLRLLKVLSFTRRLTRLFKLWTEGRATWSRRTTYSSRVERLWASPRDSEMILGRGYRGGSRAIRTESLLLAGSLFFSGRIPSRRDTAPLARIRRFGATVRVRLVLKSKRGVSTGSRAILSSTVATLLRRIG
jgi:hypothetical protein